MSKQTDKLKNLLTENRILTAPAAFDALSAKIIEKNGFDIVWISGASLTNAFLGYADVGLISYGEVKGVLQNIVNAVNIPVMVDVDTGYGGIFNIQRMIKEFESIGIAGIQIEDQTFPKRCAYFSGVNVIEVEEMEKKIKSILMARENEDFKIVARSDAGKSMGFKEAVRRAKLYFEMGADMLFLSAPKSEEEMNLMTETGLPFCTAVVEGTKTEEYSIKELGDRGFKIVKYPQTLIRSTMKTMDEALSSIKESGYAKEIDGFVATSDKRNEITDLQIFNQIEKDLNSC